MKTKRILILALGIALAACSGSDTAGLSSEDVDALATIVNAPVVPMATAVPATRAPNSALNAVSTIAAATAEAALAAVGIEAPPVGITLDEDLNERFLEYFADRGFLQNPDVTGYVHYNKRAGRGFIVAAITDNQDGQNPMFGFVSRINAMPEEYNTSLEHLYEAAFFIDPFYGADIVFTAMEDIETQRVSMVNGTMRHWWAEGETWGQFIHTPAGQEVMIDYLYEEENLLKVFFFYLPLDWEHPTE